MVKYIILCLFIVASVAVFFDVNFPKINTITVDTKKISTGTDLKILQITDLHSKTFFFKNRGLIEMIRRIEFDIVVLTGDIAEVDDVDFKSIYSLIEKIKEINPNIYYVSGNHEWRNKNVQNFIKGLKDLNVNVLNNANAIFSKDKTLVNVCGVNDPHTKRDDLEKALKDIDNKLYTILLAHSPGIINKRESTKADIVLCGHTHGGQIRLPLIGALITSGQGFFPKYDKGLFDLGNGRKLYVDSGVGCSTLPIRFLNRSQISLIKVKGKKGT